MKGFEKCFYDGFLLSNVKENISFIKEKFSKKEWNLLFKNDKSYFFYDEKDLLYLKKTDLGLIDDDMSKDLKLRFLNKHKEKLLSCFNTLDVKIKDTVEADFLKAKSATYLKILPLRFSISFSNDRALIYYLRKN